MYNSTKQAKDIKRGDLIFIRGQYATVVENYYADSSPKVLMNTGRIKFVGVGRENVDIAHVNGDDPIPIEGSKGYRMVPVQDIKEGDNFIYGIHTCVAVSDGQVDENNRSVYEVAYVFKKHPRSGVSMFSAEYDFPIVVIKD